MVAPVVYVVGLGALRLGSMGYKAYKAYKAYRQAKKLKDLKDKADKLKKAKEAAEKAKRAKSKCTGNCSKADKKYDRPSGYRKGVRDEAWENAKKKSKDGKVRDPITKKEIKPGDKWDMGHKPGYEFRKHQKDAAERGIDRKKFLDEYNDSAHYRPELPSSNRGHSGELRTGDWLGN
jgi:predicted ribonuclease toxin of YeeF-YezG toxin-antitoxin module